MKTVHLIFLTCLLLCSLSALSQEKVPPIRFLSLGTTPLNTLDPITGTLETVLELKPHSNLSGELKYGRKIEFLERILSNNISNKNHREWKMGIKYFLGAFKGSIDSTNFIASINPFIGIEHFRINHQYENSNSWLVRDGVAYRYDSSDVNRKVRGFRFRLGVAYTIDRHWGVEVYAGLGIKRINISHNTVNERREDRLLRRVVFNGPDDKKEGRLQKFDFILGFKLDYRLFTW